MTNASARVSMRIAYSPIVTIGEYAISITGRGATNGNTTPAVYRARVP